jgi:hypothetical protein
MFLVVQVGEPHEMREPPIGFPKCNNYTPDVTLKKFKKKSVSQKNRKVKLWKELDKYF